MYPFIDLTEEEKVSRKLEKELHSVYKQLEATEFKLRLMGIFTGVLCPICYLIGILS